MGTLTPGATAGVRSPGEKNRSKWKGKRCAQQKLNKKGMESETAQDRFGFKRKKNGNSGNAGKKCDVESPLKKKSKGFKWPKKRQGKAALE